MVVWSQKLKIFALNSLKIRIISGSRITGACKYMKYCGVETKSEKKFKFR